MTEPKADATTIALVASARSGDQRAYEELLEHYAPLIDSLVARYTHALEAEDLRQEACIAFCKAVERYDESREDVSFGAFAKVCIRNHLISYARRTENNEPVVSLEGEQTEELADPAQSIVDEESYLALYRHIEATLSPYESKIWWMYLSGMTAKVIAARLCRDERSVQNAVYRIRKKLRETLPSQHT